MKMNKKGFTIVELVIVIAVIAILAAVLIPTFSSIIKKANASADTQACRQMNEYLAIEGVNKNVSIYDVYATLAEGGMSAKDYKPLVSGMYYFWDSVANKVVYAKYDEASKEYKVEYPENFEKQGQWYSLTQEVAKVKLDTSSKQITTGENNKKTYTFNVDNEAELYAVGKELKDAMLNGSSEYVTEANTATGRTIVGDVVINLTQDIDFMGAPFNFSVKGNFTLNGNGHTISGIVNSGSDLYISTNNGNQTEEQYGTGIIGYLANGTATFNDVTIKDSVFGSSTSKGAAALVGYVSDSTITIKNVTIDSCTMTAYEHSAGGFIGDAQPGVIINVNGANGLSNCQLKLVASDSEAYGIGWFIGRVNNSNAQKLLQINADGATFVATNNTKDFGGNASETRPSGRTVEQFPALDDIK